MKVRLRRLIYPLLASSAAQANVLGVYPAGSACKSAAMESAVDCTEPQALLYNPSLLSESKLGFSAEVGIAQLSYSYEHPDFDPVSINLVTPMFSEGWKGSFLDGQGAWGFAVMPGSLAELNVNGIPRRIMGNAESLHIKASRRNFHIPLGASYNLGDTGANIGLAAIYTYDERTLRGSPVTNPDSELANLKARGHFVRPIIGSNINTSTSSIGASYMLPLTKKYIGKTTIASESAEFNTEQVDYDPGVLMLGARQPLGDFSISENINYLFGSKGKTVQRDGLNRKTNRADLKDAKHFGVRLDYNSNDYGVFTLGIAYLDSYWGDGHYTKDEEGFANHELGNAFGTFNAIPVRNQSVTWKKSIGTWDTHLALFRSAGTTTVGPSGDNPGYYQLEFVSLTCGIRRLM